MLSPGCANVETRLGKGEYASANLVTPRDAAYIAAQQTDYADIRYSERPCREDQTR
jgi:hypothetical protein